MVRGSTKNNLFATELYTKVYDALWYRCIDRNKSEAIYSAEPIEYVKYLRPLKRFPPKNGKWLIGVRRKIPALGPMSDFVVVNYSEETLIQVDNLSGNDSLVYNLAEGLLVAGSTSFQAEVSRALENRASFPVYYDTREKAWLYNSPSKESLTNLLENLLKDTHQKV